MVKTDNIGSSKFNDPFDQSKNPNSMYTSYQLPVYPDNWFCLRGIRWATENYIIHNYEILKSNSFNIALLDKFFAQFTEHPDFALESIL